MTDNNHPITPPPELVQQWWDGTHGAFYEFQAVATQAARWGADMELEACCEWVEREIGHGREWGAELRTTRRPKPPSLKEQALAVLDHTPKGWGLAEVDLDTIRRALESLPD